MSTTQAPPRTPRPPRQPQQRVAGQTGAKGAAASTTAAGEAGGDAAGGKKKKKKLMAVIVVVALIAAGAAYYFLVASKPKEPAAPVPGQVVALESTSLNLADGHYLRIGLALQMVESGGGGHGGTDGPDGSQAKDITITLFSGKSIEELQQPAKREKLKAELKEQIAEAYHHEVMDVYFHEFVTQ